MTHCTIKNGSTSRLFSRPQFPIALLRFSIFSIASSKGPKFSISSSRAPNFPIMLSKWWPLIFHHAIKGFQFIISSSRGLHYPHHVIKETEISKIRHVYNFWDIWHILKKVTTVGFFSLLGPFFFHLLKTWQ